MPPTDTRFPESVPGLLDPLAMFAQVGKLLSSSRACQVRSRDWRL